MSAALPSPETVAVPADLAIIGKRIDARIAALLDAEIARWRQVDAQLCAPLESLHALVLAGGKRLRPAFCHWAHVGVGGDPDDAGVVDAGAGLELLHTFALVHDDIMDGSSHRRGMAAVHHQFIDAHHSAGWRGEARRFGEGAAILIGDLSFVYADLLIGRVNPAAQAVFNELRVEVNIGQYLDLVGTARGERSVEAARQICRYKSGKYTIERPLHLGAALGDRLDDVAPALSAYGLPLGEAFQLCDDLLGALGESSRTGKPVGDDLREGKPTTLVAHALGAASPAQASVLGYIGDGGLTAGQIADVQQVLVDTGAADRVRADVVALRDEAVAAIRRSGLAAHAVDALVDLALYVTDRDH